MESIGLYGFAAACLIVAIVFIVVLVRNVGKQCNDFCSYYIDTRREEKLENFWIRLPIDSADEIGYKVIARLPCGALCLRFDKDNAAFRLCVCFGPFASYRKPLRKGDAILCCLEECVAFDRCPLIQKIIEVSGQADNDALLRRILGNLNPTDGDGNLPDVRDAKKRLPRAAVLPRLRGAITYFNGKYGFVVPPMPTEMEDADNGGDSHGDGRNADDCV